MDFAEHADLTGRLRGLVIMLGGDLTLDQARHVDELIDGAEFPVALETLAECLAENRTPVPDSIRRDFERLSTQLGNHDRVMEPLAACPTAPDTQD